MSNDQVVTPLECFYRWEQETPEKVFLRQPTKLQWHEYTWAEIADRVRRTAKFINTRNLAPGSRICIFAANSVDWFVVDLAIMLSGHISVPLYPGQDLDSANYILDHSECQLMFLGVVDQHARIDAELPNAIPRVAMLGCKTPCDYNLEAVITEHSPYTESPIPDPESTLTILYTSGTTGNPKGVMHSHGTPGKVVPGMIKAMRLDNKPERFFSYLPLSHAAERIIIEMISLYLNPTVSFSEGLETFADELRSVRPTYFFSVPRLWAKMKEGVDAKFPPEVQATFGEAEKAQIRSQLGLDQARFILTGSAPMPRDIQQWYIDMGLWLRDGYGMTENFVDGCIWHMPEKPVPGCVGKPFESAKVKLTDEGEICFRSDGLMKRYYKDPEKTAEVLVDGWYHTGDSGRYDDDNNLWVTGRISEVFKTTKGKFIKPVRIEDHFGALEVLGQVCIFGHGKDQPLLLTNLSEVALGQSQESLTKMLKEGLEAINAELPSYERVPQIFVTKESWQIDNGMLTPTLKLKRKAIEARYQDWIEGNLGGAAVTWQ